jgi:hypothetical protein
MNIFQQDSDKNNGWQQKGKGKYYLITMLIKSSVELAIAQLLEAEHMLRIILVRFHVQVMANFF